MDWQPLIDAALAVQKRAYAPYSRFPVGAAMRMEDGSIQVGCNVENATPVLTVCAERAALASAVSAGLRRPQALAVVSNLDPAAPPCGPCLQALVEFVPDLPILLFNPDGERRERRLKDLLPEPFVWRPEE